MNTRRRFMRWLPTVPIIGPAAVKAAAMAQQSPEWVNRVINHPLIHMAPQKTQTYILSHYGDKESGEWFTQLVVKDNGIRWLERWQELGNSTNNYQSWTIFGG